MHQSILRGRLRRRPPAATAIALLALFVALGGSAFAATHYLITSTHQIKPSVLSQLRGNRGPRGFGGANGRNGANGVVPQIRDIDSEILTLQPGQDTFQVDPDNFQANCPAGYTVLGTGFNTGGVGTVGFVQSFGFFVGGFFVNNAVIATFVHLQAICGVVPGGELGASDRSSGAEATYHAALRAAERRVHR